MEEKVNSIFITDTSTGTKYELDYNKDAVRMGKRMEFDPEEVTKYPATEVPTLFYLAFRMHHRNVARDKTDALLEKMGGLSPKMVTRLIALYRQAEFAGILNIDEGKNSAVTVEGLDD